jgi:glycosyltransferase involved in cell wall biosynthesis
LPIFRFLRYVKPTWYFNLRPAIDHDYFPGVNSLSLYPPLLTLDKNYLSSEAQLRDHAWNAFQVGFIGFSDSGGIDAWDNQEMPTEDEYRFIRKNFSPLWSVYVLMLRVITLHNPWNEWIGWWRTRKVKRINHAANSYAYHAYKGFNSELIEINPLVSIIIPTLNRYPYLKDVLKDLENQSYKNFEVIVVDQSEPFDEAFYSSWNFKLRYWYQEEKALWKARNDAICAAQGDYLLLYDDDSRVEPNWIEQHLKTLEFFKADISSGVSISTVGAKVPAHYSYFRWSDQLDTGNVLIKREVFEKIGLFDRQFEKQRMGDGEFGLRAYLSGFRNISNPYAKRLHMKVGEGGLRQMGSWDAFRPKSLFSPRPVPSVLYFYRRYFGVKASILVIITSVLPSIVPYRLKQKQGLMVLSFILLPILLPVLAFQVIGSWTASSKKIRQGPIIGNLAPR